MSGAYPPPPSSRTIYDHELPEIRRRAAERRRRRAERAAVADAAPLPGLPKDARPWIINGKFIAWVRE